MKTQVPDSDVDLYVNDPARLFKNVKRLLSSHRDGRIATTVERFPNRKVAADVRGFQRPCRRVCTVLFQEGEDVLLARFFDYKKEGFYVDVGAHHPKRFSNTFFLYKLGWRGINIEPNHDVKKIFDEIRSGDINVEMAIANNESEKTFYMFQETALNTFSQSLAEQMNGLGIDQ